MLKFIEKIKPKKGMSQIWWVISAAVIALIIVVLIIVWFRGSGGKAFDTVDTQIDSLGDCDGDDIANMFDKCPCDPEGENPELEGCPDSVTKDNDPGKLIGKEDCICSSS